MTEDEAYEFAESHGEEIKFFELLETLFQGNNPVELSDSSPAYVAVRQLMEGDATFGDVDAGGCVFWDKGRCVIVWPENEDED